jgi:ketosteroid isomerase-like protein
MGLSEQELIGRVREAIEAFNRGDYDEAAEIAHPDIVFIRPGGLTEIRGADKIRAWMEPDAFEEQMLSPTDFQAAGNKVLIRQHARARGAGSGIEVELDTWSVWTFDENGKVTKVESFSDQEEAAALSALRAT